ncbi:GNAT family N-acetyltransferase [Chloroflexota bacterium]
MNKSDYTIRNYHPSDFDSYLLLLREAETQLPIGRPTSPHALNERFSHPGYTPEEDIFVIEKDGELVGYADIMPELSIKRAILYCWIHPDHRLIGLARKLIDCASERAKKPGAEVLHVNISEDNETAVKALSRLGFQYVRRFLNLRLDMNSIEWQGIDRDSLGCRKMAPGEEDKLAIIQNRAFSDHWGYNPNTIEEITYDATRMDHSQDDIIVSCDGDKFIGYCWTEVAEGNTPDEGKGQIYMIGSDPDYRGTGAGKRVLLAGLAHLKTRGVPVTELTVDSENEIACALYESTGFEVTSSSLWYEKVIE